MPRAVFFLPTRYRLGAVSRDLEKLEDWGPHRTLQTHGIWGQEQHRQSWAPQLVVRNLRICCLPWPHWGRAMPGSKWHG